MAESIFTRIINKQLPATIVYEDDRAVAFRDIRPQAPVHILVVPRKEIPRIGAAEPADEPLLGHLLWVAAEVARREKVADSGYRLVINNGPHAGEAVPHLHVHVLGGRPMSWPPG